MTAAHTPAHDTAHDHAVDLEACLGFVNTEELTDGVPVEALDTVAAAITFLVGHDLGHVDELGRQAELDGADAWLARIRTVRAALRATWDAQVAGRAPDPGALAELNRLLDLAPRAELRATPSGVEVGHHHPGDDPTGEALARLVEPLVEAIGEGHTHRFRVCANDGCRWVFEDTSRAGRRRWCDMATCGNRAKVRRFRSRRRDGAGADPPSDQSAESGTGTGVEGRLPT